jgi:hypothetical protein
VFAFLRRVGKKNIAIQPITKYKVKLNFGIALVANDLYNIPTRTIAHCTTTIKIPFQPPIITKATGV